MYLMVTSFGIAPVFDLYQDAKVGKQGQNWSSSGVQKQDPQIETGWKQNKHRREMHEIVYFTAILLLFQKPVNQRRLLPLGPG